MWLLLASEPLNSATPSSHSSRAKANNQLNIRTVSILTQKFGKCSSKNYYPILTLHIHDNSHILSSGSPKTTNQPTSSTIMSYKIYCPLGAQTLNFPQTTPFSETSKHHSRSAATVSPSCFRNTPVVYTSQRMLGHLLITGHS